MADAHYFLGMALVNQGKLAEAKAPLTGVHEARRRTGQNAADAANLLKIIK